MKVKTELIVGEIQERLYGHHFLQVLLDSGHSLNTVNVDECCAAVWLTIMHAIGIFRITFGGKYKKPLKVE